MNELISVIVPVYNVEKYLGKCLDSLIKQTYKNIEIIVVNDGTKDKSLEIAKQKQKSDKRITIISQKNAGLSAARNTGLKYAKGNYIGFIDSDDYIESTMYEELYNQIIKHKADIVICDFVEESEDGKILKEKEYTNSEIEIYDRNTALQELITQQKITNHAWNKLYKKELFDTIEFPVGQLMEDISTTYKLFEKSKKIVFSKKKLYHYIQRGNSILGNISDRRIRDQFNAINDRNKELKVKYPDLVPYITVDNIKLLKDIYYLSYISGNFNFCDNYQYKSTYDELKIEYKRSKNQINSEHKKSCYLFYNTKFLYTLYILLVKGKGKKIFKYLKFLFRTKLSYIWEFITIYKSNKCISNSKNKNVAYIFLAADYGNYGDVAITYAQKTFLQETLPNYQVVEIPANETYSYIKNIKKNLKKEDLITIIGGGNMSNKYSYYESLRRAVLRNFYKHRIVCFPQTADYTDDSYGYKEFNRTKRIIKKCKDITVIAREKSTYELFSKNLRRKSVKIYMMPDIVLFLKDKIQYNTNRSDKIGVCFRNDQEEVNESKLLKKKILDEITNITPFNTCDENNFNYNNRYDNLFNILNIISKFKQVYTDRLHAMIFCYLTNTECIYIDNTNKKISKTHKMWLSHSKKIKQYNTTGIENRKSQLESKFYELKKIIRKD